MGIWFIMCVINLLLQTSPSILKKYKKQLLGLSSQTFAIYLYHIPVAYVFNTYFKLKIETTTGLFTYLAIATPSLLILPILLNKGLKNLLNSKSLITTKHIN